MKKCPFCAEEIHDEAKKCKHCGEFIQLLGTPATNNQNHEIDGIEKTGFSILGVIIGLVAGAVAGLFLFGMVLGIGTAKAGLLIGGIVGAFLGSRLRPMAHM